MTDLRAHGISVTLPVGWEGRVFRRPATGEVGAAAADGPAAPPGETTNAVVHVATIPLPPGVGDFASGTVEDLGPNDALIVLFEYDPSSTQEPLFAVRGVPRQLAPSDFSPSVLQRTLRGQAGVQQFFQEAGRAFCLYVVLGSFERRDRVVPVVNEVLATLAVGDVAAPAGTTTTTLPGNATVMDAIGARSELVTFARLLEDANLDELLRTAGPYTVFAPHDGAFTAEDLAALGADRELLVRTLSRHVVNGRIAPAELRGMQNVTTLVGSVPIVVENDAVRVGGVEVDPVALDAGNGIVYLVRAVLDAPR